MNRRDFLYDLRKLCVLYGIQGVLSENAFAAESPQRMINFVIKYTGGTTSTRGIGQWTFNNTLSPLQNYANDMAFPLGLNAKFNVDMNSHASPQVCALSGAMTGSEKLDGVSFYPVGDLRSVSTGNGKSIDVLIGEKLQREYKTALPYLLLTNNDSTNLTSTHRSSSWAGNKVILPIQRIDALSETIRSKLLCDSTTLAQYEQRLKALEYIKKNNNIFSSSYLINKEKFEQIEERTISTVGQFQTNMGKLQAGQTQNCTLLDETKNTRVGGTQARNDRFQQKMNRMYDLAIYALQNNITRTITFNLYSATTHATSHYVANNSLDAYYTASRNHQASIASFLNKLNNAGLYQNTLVYCNAGSAMSNEVHNFENLSTYIINGGVSGIRGSAGTRRPMGSLLVDILRKFGINYAQYGGTNHSLGVGRPGGYI